MTKNTLSVVLATFNEEQNIGDCLESVKDIADEIIVVDGGSADNTVEIAKSYGAKVISTDNPPIFHINKNKAVKAAKFDWILQLDADERVTENLAEEIRKVVNANESKNGYWIPRSNFFLGRFLKKGGQYPDYTLRLYKNGKGILPAKDVHEQAIVEGEVGYLKNDLLHLRDKNFKKYISGLDRYTNLISLQFKQEKVRINLVSLIDYLIIKPISWFLKAYIRHKGFVDGYQGFIFALFSALRFPIAFLKYLGDRK